MKKFNYLWMCSASILLAACSSDSLVDGTAPAGAEPTPMTFGVASNTMSRDGLETESVNFGVWAYKGDNDLVAAGDALIMGNYLVGWNQTSPKGYNSAGANMVGETSETTNWFYDMLGYGQYTSTDTDYLVGAGQYGANMSNNENQFLKYFDPAFAYTNFYAYAPYITTTANNSVEAPTFDPTTQTLTFKTAISSGSENNLMYAQKAVASTAYGQKVVLNFKHLSAQLHVKLYEVVAGYRVRIKSVTTAGVTYAGDIVAVPADVDAGVYSKGSWISSAVPAVTFTSATAASVSYLTPTTDDSNICFAKPDDSTVLGVADAWIGENDRANATDAGSMNWVIPADATARNSGFIFYISYELVAEDTHEVIAVNNAAVYVPADYTQWLANYSYTYIFKISEKSNGNGNPEGPTVPDDNYLLPIIFDGCTVTEYSTFESEWEVNNPANNPTWHNP